MKKYLLLFIMSLMSLITTLNSNAQAPCSISLTSAVGTDDQKVCANVGFYITDITYSVSGSSANVTGLPQGVTSSFSTGVFTISGMPDPGILGTFNYTVTTTGGCNPDANATGKITIYGPPVADFTYAGPYNQNATNPTPNYSNGGTPGTFSSTTGLVFVSPVNTPGEVDLLASMPGTYTVTNSISSGGICPLIQYSNTITINSKPKLSSTLNPVPIISGTIFTYTPTSTSAGATFTWSRATLATIKEAGTNGTGNVSEVLTNTTASPVYVTYVYTTTANGQSSTQNVIVKVITTLEQFISAGNKNSLFLCGVGKPMACGDNYYGQLGDGTTMQKKIPIQVNGLTNITAISAVTGYHSLFLKHDSTVWACGDNLYGELGDGTTSHRSIPVKVSGLTGIIAIAGGSVHSLFLKSDGTVWACGNNSSGQYGGQNGSYTDSHIPIHVTGLSGIIAIAGGSEHSIFLKNDGTVWSCGRNSAGQLGIGTTSTDYPYPTQISGLTGITAIAGGNGHSLFLKNDGTVWACGDNAAGQLGEGRTATLKNAPVQVIGVTGITAIDAGGSYSLFLKNDSTVLACGYNNTGGLGDGTTTQRNTSIQVSGLTNVTAISAGGYHSLFLKKDGSVWACGANTMGQLSDGTTNEQHIPILVSGASPAITSINSISICTGDTVNIALTSNINATYTWQATDNPNTTGESTTLQTTSTLNNILTNTTAYVQKITYTIIPTACNVGIPQTVTVTVNPIPNLSSSLNIASICSGSNVAYTVTSATANATYNWSRASVPGISEPGTSGTGNLNEPLTNTTASSINVIYKYITTANGCSNTEENAEVTVNPCVVVAVNNPTICSGSSATLIASGATSYSWSPGGATTSSISVSPLSTITYTVTGTAGVSTSSTIATITVNPDAAISLTSAVGTDAQSICKNTAVTIINYSVTGGGTGATVTGLPAGVSGAFASGIVTITGVPNVSGTFNYTVTTTGTCLQTKVTGNITVTASSEITLTSAAGTDAQSKCINTAITDITYSVSTSATGATITALPSGVTSTYASNVFTISGTPSVVGTFNYTLTPTGISGACTYQIGNITVNPDAVLTLTSAVGTDSQTVCINNAVADITYSVSGGGTGASATGISGAFSGGIFTIPGTSNAGTSAIWKYTVTTTGTCVQAKANGIKTVNPNASLTLVSGSAQNNQTICVNTAILTIKYELNKYGATGASVAGLPVGVSGAMGKIPPSGGFLLGSGDSIVVFTISGTPSVAGTYTYTVTATGSCLPATATGTITVNPDASISLTSALGTDAQNACINFPITNITYTVSSNVSGANATGLPTGVTMAYAGGLVTLSGTPSVKGTYNYTVITTGPCVQTKTIGSIIVDSCLNVTVNNESICFGTSATLTASGADSYSWAPGGETTNLITVSPTTTTTYTVTGTSGGSSSSTLATVTVNQIPVVTVNSETICAGSSATLTASGANTYVWSDNSTNDFLTVSPGTTTSYTVTGTSTGCSDTSIGTINVTPLQDASFTYSPSTVCKADGSDPVPVITGVSGGTFTFAPTGLVINSTTGTIDLALSPVGTYTVTYTTVGPCSDLSTYVIAIVNVADATFSYGVYCQNSTPNPIPSYPSGSSAGDYTESSGGIIFVNPITTPGEIHLAASTPGTYTVTNTIAASGSCSASISTNTITINPVPATTVNNSTICAGATATLIASGANTYLWSDNSTSTSLTVSPTSTTSYTVTGASAGCVNSAIATVTVNLYPVVTTTSNGTAITANQTGAVYQWLDCNNNFTAINGETNKSYTPGKTGNYAVGLNLNGCKDTSSCINVIINCSSYFSTEYDTIQNTFILNVDSATAALADSYFWDFGDGQTSNLATPTHVYTVDTLYNVCLKITTTSGASCTYCHEIGKDSLGNIYRMSGFTVNVKNQYLQTGLSYILPTENSFVVYPNPNNGSFTVESKTEGTYSIINELGQTIQHIQLNSANQYTVNIDNMNSGIYFIVGLNNKKMTKQKVVVAK